MKLPVYVAFMVIVLAFALACQWWWEHNRTPEAIEDPSCMETQNHLIDIGCHQYFMIPGQDYTYGTNDDIYFLEFCEDVQSSGITVLDLECVVKSRTCSQVEECLHVND